MVSTKTPTMLERILGLDQLRWAWHRVRANKGKPGADHVSLGRFSRLLDANLLTLADEVRAGRYQPGPLRRVTIQTGRKRRMISILPVRDRVLQRAALDILTPRLDPTFLPCSFGYRPGCSLQNAVERIVHLRDRGLTWIVDADIEECFSSLDHTLLREFIDQAVPEPAVANLLMGWVTGPARPGHAVATHGIALGGVISPLLCNLYLHHLDCSLRQRRYQLVRYADDFVILCKSAAHAETALHATGRVLRGLRLTLNAGKTRIVSFDQGFTFLGVDFKGTDYRFVANCKRITVDELPPEWFYDNPAGYGEVD